MRGQAALGRERAAAEEKERQAMVALKAAAEAGDVVTLPRGATDRELLAALGPGSAHDDTAVPPFEDSP